MMAASRLATTAAAIALQVSATLVGVTNPSFAQGTPAPKPLTSQQCNMIQAAFSDYIQVNHVHFSNEDKAELRRFSAWLGNGCQGSIVLARRPEVVAAMGAVQTMLMGHSRPEYRVQLAGHVRLG